MNLMSPKCQKQHLFFFFIKIQVSGAIYRDLVHRFASGEETWTFSFSHAIDFPDWLPLDRLRPPVLLSRLHPHHRPLHLRWGWSLPSRFGSNALRTKLCRFHRPGRLYVLQWLQVQQGETQARGGGMRGRWRMPGYNSILISSTALRFMGPMEYLVIAWPRESSFPCTNTPGLATELV